MVQTCSCNMQRSILINTTSKSCMLYEDFKGMHGSCLHIDALISVIIAEGAEIRATDHQYASADDGEHFYQVPFDPNMFVLCRGDDCTYLSGKDGRPYCHMCADHHSCRHIKGLTDGTQVEQGVWDEWGDRLQRSRARGQENIPTALRIDPISFHIPPHLKDLFCKALCNPMTLYPTMGGVCSCGAPYSNQRILSGTPKPLYSTTATVACQSYHYACTNGSCEGKLHPQHPFILQMGSYFVHHNLLRDYMSHFLCSGTSMYNYHQSLMINLQDYGVVEIITYKRFRWAWLSFLKLVDIQEVEGFCCPQCGPNPRAVVMDGTTLGYHRRFAKQPQATPPTQDQGKEGR
ncbi:uncharacterized protein LOC143142334 [Alosa pseudoharengus]|uniref:uncharacterized protein LOC143136564 n=1 Tax=Alosa pseudoharengus TaxID=34774 RepID=UPI003F89B52F